MRLPIACIDNSYPRDLNSNASDAMRSENMEVICEYSNTVKSLELFLKNTQSNGFPVLGGDGDGHICGYISRHDLQYVVGREACDLLWLPRAMTWDAARVP